MLLVNEYKDGANGYYAELYNPLHVAKTVIYVTQTVMGDAVMVSFPLQPLSHRTHSKT